MYTILPTEVMNDEPVILNCVKAQIVINLKCSTNENQSYRWANTKL